MNFKLPNDVKEIIKIFENNNFLIYLVGGCVRDLLLGREINDYDFATNAFPNQIKVLLSDKGKVIPTGEKYGTVTFLYKNSSYEITTFRTDGNYSDNRKPDNVLFASDINEDLKRRDFTVNALAYNPNNGIIDNYGGIKDLENKIIRCVGNPEERINEDALRILRAFRFRSKLKFTIEKNTLDAMKKNQRLLLNISYERIYKELKEILNNGIDIRELFFINIIIPELNDCAECFQNNIYHNTTVLEHILRSVNNIENRFDLKLTMLLHDIAKPDVKTTDINGVDHFKGHEALSAYKAEIILKRLRAEKNVIKKVKFLIANHHYPLYVDKLYIKEAMFQIGKENYIDLVKVIKADTMAKNISILGNLIDGLNELDRLIDEINMNNEPFCVGDLLLNGNDLIRLGITDGFKIKSTLEFLLRKVWENPSLNKYNILTDIVKKECM